MAVASHNPNNLQIILQKDFEIDTHVWLRVLFLTAVDDQLVIFQILLAKLSSPAEVVTFPHHVSIRDK